MNAIAILEIITLLADLYYRYADMGDMTDEEKEARLMSAVSEKSRRKAGDLPDA